MINLIRNFIDSKVLSENSKRAYFYDLQQFVTLVDGKVTEEKLALYEQSLLSLTISAKKRKISAVNQFLYFMYQQEKVDRFYKLQNKDKLPMQAATSKILDLSLLYQPHLDKEGQVIALLILELGLTPAEIRQLTSASIDVNFAIMTLQKDGIRRVLKISQELLGFIEGLLIEKQTYLFDNNDKVYSRQWYFNHLKQFLRALGYDRLTAQVLREQYILRQVTSGKSLIEISRNLGLKSPVTLEKYYKK